MNKNRNRHTDIENSLVLDKGQGGGVEEGRIGSLELAEANYYL